MTMKLQIEVFQLILEYLDLFVQILTRKDRSFDADRSRLVNKADDWIMRAKARQRSLVKDE